MRLEEEQTPPVVPSPHQQNQFAESSSPVIGLSPSTNVPDPSEQILKLMQSLGIDANKTREVNFRTSSC